MTSKETLRQRKEFLRKRGRVLHKKGRELHDRTGTEVCVITRSRVDGDDTYICTLRGFSEIPDRNLIYETAESHYSRKGRGRPRREVYMPERPSPPSRTMPQQGSGEILPVPNEYRNQLEAESTVFDVGDVNGTTALQIDPMEPTSAIDITTTASNAAKLCENGLEAGIENIRELYHGSSGGLFINQHEDDGGYVGGMVQGAVGPLPLGQASDGNGPGMSAVGEHPRMGMERTIGLLGWKRYCTLVKIANDLAGHLDCLV
ncbi:hypothetical protein JX265_008396 [Neoarthrinium moseri]|uniref:MADS-box domain-containing protein n=1 Tax=Neoarthrinium moseri TaxID=1658444 RepID=A0A9P9WI53_9PEZI|nr:hypothetical protein JX266_008813 [Neoarthrinium moseri]KAI1864672.1 hypothetical protein JX265_008396 [Neoarthrinium moseri]